MLRFAFYGHGQSSHVAARRHAMSVRGSLPVLPRRAGPGYRRAELAMAPATDRAKGLLRAANGRANTLGQTR